MLRVAAVFLASAGLLGGACGGQETEEMTGRVNELANVLDELVGQVWDHHQELSAAKSVRDAQELTRAHYMTATSDLDRAEFWIDQLEACESENGSRPYLDRLRGLHEDAVAEVTGHWLMIALATDLDAVSAESERYVAAMMGVMGGMRSDQVGMDAVSAAYLCPMMGDQMPPWTDMDPPFDSDPLSPPGGGPMGGHHPMGGHD